MSSLQDSTALMLVFSSSIVILMEERMALKLGKFSGFSSFTLTMPCSPTGEVATHLYSQPTKAYSTTSLRC